MEIKGKIAMVTGAARGIGKAYAEELLKKGAKVLVADISSELGQETVQEFQKQYGQDSCSFAKADVTSQQSMEHVFNTAVKEIGGLDIMINNAGIGVGTVEQIYEVNVFGLMRCTELGVENMKKEKGGRGGIIVNISSIAALRVLPLGQEYCPSKAAVLGYSRSLGKFLGDSHEVKIRVLCPGFVETDMTAGFKQKEDEGMDLVVKQLELAGGWTDKHDVVRACMGCIEKDLEQGAVIRALADGIVQVFPEQMPETPLHSAN